jgi:hypothetical protein
MELDGDTQQDGVVKTVVERIETTAMMQVGVDGKRKDRKGSDPDSERDRGRHRKKSEEEEVPGVAVAVIENMMRRLMKEHHDDKDEQMTRRVEGAMERALEAMDDRIEQRVKDKMEDLRAEVKEDIEEIAGATATVAKKLEEVNTEYLNFKGEERCWREEVEKKLSDLQERLPVSVMWPTKGEAGDAGEAGYGHDPWAESWKTVGSKGKSKGAGKGKEDKKKEEMGRTITIGSYKDTTLAAEVVEHLGGILEKEKENGNIEEVFAFGRKRASRGAARFVSTEAMWRYMVAEKGNHRHTSKDGQDVYLSVAQREDGEDTEMTKGVRKVVRAVMETMVGEGKYTREDARDELGANYKQGVVKFAGETWATWSAAAKKMEWNTQAKAGADAAKRYLELTA